MTFLHLLLAYLFTTIFLTEQMGKITCVSHQFKLLLVILLKSVLVLNIQVTLRK